jgi:hypothetical protein
MQNGGTDKGNDPDERISCAARHAERLTNSRLNLILTMLRKRSDSAGKAKTKGDTIFQSLKVKFLKKFLKKWRIFVESV